MKTLERITLVTTSAVTIAAAAYIAQKVIRLRVERLYRAAAGESRYERKHANMHRASHA